MPGKFRNKYRIGSKRLKDYDYSTPGKYFITICTLNRETYFGNENQLSEIGCIARQEWLKTPEIRSDMNLKLDEFVIMPDHFHAILIIGENDNNCRGCRNVMHHVSTKMHHVSTFKSPHKNLGSVIRGFKSAVTTFARKNKLDFGWQPRYYDHIIRNDAELKRIRKYIKNNRVKL